MRDDAADRGAFCRLAGAQIAAALDMSLRLHASDVDRYGPTMRHEAFVPLSSVRLSSAFRSLSIFICASKEAECFIIPENFFIFT
jgi:hypothetical protein